MKSTILFSFSAVLCWGCVPGESKEDPTTPDSDDSFIPREGSYNFNVYSHELELEELCGADADGFGIDSELSITDLGFSLEVNGWPVEDNPIVFNCVLEERSFECDPTESEVFSLLKDIPEGQGTNASLRLYGDWAANGVYADTTLGVTMNNCVVSIPGYIG